MVNSSTQRGMSPTPEPWIEPPPPWPAESTAGVPTGGRTGSVGLGEGDGTDSHATAEVAGVEPTDGDLGAGLGIVPTIEIVPVAV